MKTTFFLLMALLALPLAAIAQERSAGQANDAQVNWAALKNSIDLVSSQNKALAATVDKLMTCNRKGLVYNPSAASVDSDECALTACPTGTLDGGTGCVDESLTRINETGGSYGQVYSAFTSAAKTCAKLGKRVATINDMVTLCNAGKGPPAGRGWVIDPNMASSGTACNIDRSTTTNPTSVQYTLCVSAK